MPLEKTENQFQRQKKEKNWDNEISLFNKKRKKNKRVERKDFDFRRPGNGVIKPYNFEYFLGRKYSCDLNIGQLITGKHIN